MAGLEDTFGEDTADPVPVLAGLAAASFGVGGLVLAGEVGTDAVALAGDRVEPLDAGGFTLKGGTAWAPPVGVGGWEPGVLGVPGALVEADGACGDCSVGGPPDPSASGFFSPSCSSNILLSYSSSKAWSSSGSAAYSNRLKVPSAPEK